MSMKSSCGGDDAELRRGPWTLQEDTLLVHYIASYGEGNWNVLAKRSGLKRTGKSCRLRWLNYLKPDVKRGNLSPQEQLLILQLHSRWGNRWSKIAQELPGRTDNEIKNYWRTRIHKQARLLNMDTNSTAFQDTIRYFWIPRLLEKIQHSSPPSPDSSPILPPNPILNPDPAQEHVQFEYQVYSDQSTSSSVTCSDSVNMFQASNVSCTTTTPFQSSESYYQAMECSNIENYENPIQSCDGFGDDGLWGLDELWQFR